MGVACGSGMWRVEVTCGCGIWAWYVGLAYGVWCLNVVCGCDVWMSVLNALGHGELEMIAVLSLVCKFLQDTCFTDDPHQTIAIMYPLLSNDSRRIISFFVTIANLQSSVVQSFVNILW